jgi:hypothetical protein
MAGSNEAGPSRSQDSGYVSGSRKRGVRDVSEDSGANVKSGGSKVRGALLSSCVRCKRKIQRLKRTAVMTESTCAPMLLPPLTNNARPSESEGFEIPMGAVFERREFYLPGEDQPLDEQDYDKKPIRLLNDFTVLDATAGDKLALAPPEELEDPDSDACLRVLGYASRYFDDTSDEDIDNEDDGDEEEIDAVSSREPVLVYTTVLKDWWVDHLEYDGWVNFTRIGSFLLTNI